MKVTWKKNISISLWLLRMTRKTMNPLSPRSLSREKITSLYSEVPTITRKTTNLLSPRSLSRERIEE